MRSSTPKSARQQVLRRFATLDPRRKVAPKTVQTLRAAEQGRENCRVGQQNVASPRAARWHPQKAVELAVSHFSKWMRSRQVDRLFGQNQNRLRIFCGHRIVRQMRVKIKGRDAGEPPAWIEVLHGCQRSDLFGAG